MNISSPSELLAIQSVLQKSISDELRGKKNTGFVVKQRGGGAGPSVAPIHKNKTTYVKRIKYIRFVLNQKWEYLFDGSNLNNEKKYYVYAHCDPSITTYDISKDLNITGLPFYIGKGTGSRAWDMCRNQGHDLKVKKVLGKIHDKNKIVRIVKDNLSEVDALILESKLIYIFQTVYEDQVNGILYNLDIGKRPTFETHEAAERVTVLRRKRPQESAREVSCE